MCAFVYMDTKKSKILKCIIKCFVKEKVMPVFVIPGPDFKLIFDEIPTKVYKIQPDEI